MVLGQLFNVKPIGRVARSTYDEIHKQELIRKNRREAINRAVADITIDEDYEDGLLGLGEGDHVWIIFWFDREGDKGRKILQGHPMGDKSKPLKGVFALRSPMRPNPLGLTRVRILGREGNQLTVKGLDAFSGTPIIDIKISFEQEER